MAGYIGLVSQNYSSLYPFNFVAVAQHWYLENVPSGLRHVLQPPDAQMAVPDGQGVQVDEHPAVGEAAWTTPYPAKSTKSTMNLSILFSFVKDT